MAYVQRFGLSRKSPLAAFGEPSKAKTEEKTPANDVINKENKKSSDNYSFLDGVTDTLTVAGLVPGFGIIPDAANTLLNLGRAGVAAVTGGDTSKYIGNAGLAGLAMIPGVGQGVSACCAGINFSDHHNIHSPILSVFRGGTRIGKSASLSNGHVGIPQ